MSQQFSHKVERLPDGLWRAEWALYALCHVAALNFKKMIEEERQHALAGIMIPEN